MYKILICKAINSGEIFMTIADRTISKPKYKFKIDSEIHDDWAKSPFGFICNVSSGIINEPYHKIYEYDMETYKSFPKYDPYNIESRKIFKNYFLKKK